MANGTGIGVIRVVMIGAMRPVESREEDGSANE
jgi:hypothetical protein